MQVDFSDFRKKQLNKQSTTLRIMSRVSRKIAITRVRVGFGLGLGLGLTRSFYVTNAVRIFKTFYLYYTRHFPFIVPELYSAYNLLRSDCMLWRYHVYGFLVVEPPSEIDHLIGVYACDVEINCSQQCLIQHELITNDSLSCVNLCSDANGLNFG